MHLMNPPSFFPHRLTATLIGRTLASVAPAAIYRIQQLQPFVPAASRIAQGLAAFLR